MLKNQSFLDNNVGRRIWDMKPRPTDIWLVTYPKSGTTMTQELLWQMSTGCNVESEDSKKHLFIRSPFLEMTQVRESRMGDVPGMPEDFITYAEEELKDPRILKTHLPVSMLPPEVLEISKVVVTSRNPKDVCVSMYHHGPGLAAKTSFDDHAERFMRGEGGAGGGDYWKFLKDSLKNKDHPNVKLLWYEKIVPNFEATVKELSSFTGFDVSEEKIKVMVEHMKIENFRKNDAVKFNARSGKVGGWESHFQNKNVLEKFDKWIIENNKDALG